MPPDYRAVATQVAQKYGIPAKVFLAQINQESGFNPNARSGAGAEGIAQFMPATAKEYGVDPMNPMSALDGAGRYDQGLLKQYGSVARMLSAYNSGRADAYKDPGFAGGQTYNYVRSILGASGGVSGSPKAVAARAASQAPAPQRSDQNNALLSYLSSSLGNYAKTGQASGDPMTLLTALQAQQAPSPIAPLPQPSQGRTAAPVASQQGLVQIPGTNYQANSAILPNVESITKRFGVRVNSAYRSPEHNAAVGGAEHSDHLSGNAIDFVGSPQQMQSLYQWAQGRFPYVEPWGQAGGNHVHISFIR